MADKSSLPAYCPAMTIDSIWQKSAKPTELLYTIFLRLVAVSCFYFGLRYWGMLIGYSNHGLSRFDLLNNHWRTVASLLAVIYPIAALGLWSGVSWGAVLWVVAAGCEVLMYGFWPELYGHNQVTVAMHVMVACLFAVFNVLRWYQRREASRAVTIDSL